MKLTAILKEIKVQKPGFQIMLTDEGKSAIEDIASLRMILNNLVGETSFEEVFDEHYHTEKLITSNYLKIFIDEGAIFENKSTPLEHYYGRMSEFWDNDKETQDKYLKTFLEYKYIYPFKLK